MSWREKLDGLLGKLLGRGREVPASAPPPRVRDGKAVAEEVREVTAYVGEHKTLDELEDAIREAIRMRDTQDVDRLRRIAEEELGRRFDEEDDDPAVPDAD